MQHPRYAIRSAPQYQQRQGPLGALTEFAKSQAMSRGIDAAFPGGGLAKDAALAVAPTFFNMGGPIGGGMKESELMEARRLGALSQKEFLKAMEHGGYLKGQGPLAGIKYKQAGGKVTHEAEVKYHNPLSGGSKE